MATRTSIILLLALVVASSVVATCLAAEVDPELKQCRHQCKHQEQFSEKQQRQCEQKCEDYYRQKKEREREHRERKSEPWSREEGREIGNPWDAGEKEEEGGSSSREVEQNPYVFEKQHFRSKVETEHGRVSFLPKFTKRSNLFRGIENFRLGVFEANPQTFVIPSHIDAEIVLFVASGRGTITMLHENKRKSINVEKGDIVRVPAGTPIYGTNRDDSERLYIVKLLQPVNQPGHFRAYHATAGQNPESFYTAFSWDVLEAALKTDRDQLQRLFGKQQQGAIVKASKEQIEALSGRDEEGTMWPFGGETKGTRSSHSFNLFSKRPAHSNQYGQLYWADRDDFRALKDLDVMVSFANISEGSMLGPYFNSKATKISMVIEGEGSLEMACPHLAQQQQQQGGQSQRRRQSTQGGQTYQQVRARLNPGTVFIVPAGHPVVAVASQNSNLQIICFEVNAENNVKYTLAGKNNIVRHLEREAKELAFNFPAREVERIFRSQDEEWFFPGPNRQEGRRHADE